MLRKLVILLAVPLLCTALLNAQQNGVLGLWREPGGSVIDVRPCGNDLCLSIARVRPDAPSPFDIHNPDAALRTRRLCGLTIGHAFHPTSPTHAEAGTLYDPKSGHTYGGEMTADANQLHLRGYLGVRAFGRTEVWQRLNQPPPPCPA